MLAAYSWRRPGIPCLYVRPPVVASMSLWLGPPLSAQHCTMHEANVTAFVSKYNAQVAYDESLTLKEHAAKRQANLLKETKCSARMKEMIRQRVNMSDTFESSGLSLSMMNQPEFWVGAALTTTTHAQWKSLLCTSADSCRDLSLTSGSAVSSRGAWAPLPVILQSFGAQQPLSNEARGFWSWSSIGSG